MTWTRLSARSISRSVWDSKIGPVLAVFEHACNLVTPDGDVVALVLPEIGDGPLNVVVERLDQSSRPVHSGVFRALEPGMVACFEGTRLRVGGLEVELDQSEPWEPRPGWNRLRQNRERIGSRLPLLRALALRHLPKGSLLSLLLNQATETIDLTGFGKPIRSGKVAIQEALQHLKTGWAGNSTLLQAGATQLAGLGGGLTPAGDDFLAGVMLRAWLAHPTPDALCQLVLEAAAPRTTILSAAFLRAAARGECSAAWHRLFSALASGAEDQLAEPVRDVLSYGHTSGADTLAGFLWMGHISTHNPQRGIRPYLSSRSWACNAR